MRGSITKRTIIVGAALAVLPAAAHQEPALKDRIPAFGSAVEGLKHAR